MSRLLQRVFRLSADDVLPLTIEHQRIYILPTRRGWAFLAVLLLMLLASINYALSLGYALSFLLTGLFAASLLHTYRNLAGLVIERVQATDAFAGETARFTLSVGPSTVRSRHDIRIDTRDKGSTTLARTLSMNDSSGTGIALDVPTRTRGRHALGRLTLSSDWPLGLWRAWSYLHAPLSATVYPAPEANAPALPQQAGERGESARPSTTQDGDVAGLRGYRPGDAPSRIAWKSAARSDKLHVRLVESPSGPAQVSLDLSATGIHEREARLSRLSAWVLAAADAHTPFSLSLPGSADLPMDSGAAHRQAALRALAVFDRPNEPEAA